MLLEQKDTYFQVPEGRLKLREEGERAELIFYRRPDRAGPRTSEYEIVPVESATALADLLGDALGVVSVVMKRRRLYLFGSVRIHIDSVMSLGDFLEFEAVMDQGDEEEAAAADMLIARLMKEFSVSPEDLVGQSYCDLLRLQEHSE